MSPYGGIDMGERYGIAAFRSRSHVLRLEAAARQAGIRGTIVSTPRAVAAGCGLSLKVDEKDLPRLREMLSRSKDDTLIGLYLAESSAGRTRLQTYAK